MSRFLAWYRKEWREHRLLVLLVVALPVGVTAAPYLIDHWSVDRKSADRWPVLAVVLATLVLGLDLFAREVRRGPHALILRTPGAFRAAFLGKWVFFASATGLALLAALLTKWWCQSATGAPHLRIPYLDDSGRWVMLRMDENREPHRWWGLPDAVFLPIVAAVAGSWHVVGSLWTRKGGPASLLALIWVVLLGLPFGWIWTRHYWCFCWPPGVVAVVTGIGVLALLLSALAWGRGRRFLAAGHRAWVPGTVLVAAVAGLGTAAAAWHVERWEVVDPGHDGFRIADAYLSPSGRYLYANVYRGRRQPEARSYDPATWEWGGRLSVEPWLPMLPLRIDLDTADFEVTSTTFRARFGDVGYDPGKPYSQLSSFVPFSWVALYVPFLTSRGDESSRTSRIHADTGRTDPWDVPPGLSPEDGAKLEAAHVLTLHRERRRAASPYRDAAGNPIWWDDGRRRIREGQVVLDMPSGGKADRPQAIWDGWRCSWTVEGRAPVAVYLGAQASDLVPLGDWKPAAVGQRGLLVTEDLELRMELKWDQEEEVFRVTEPWHLWRRSTGEIRALPDMDLEGGPMAVLHRGMVLRLAPDPRGASPRLFVWRPETEERVRVRCADRSMESPGWFQVVGRAAGDRWVVRLFRNAQGMAVLIGMTQTTWYRMPSGPAGPRPEERYALALLDARSGSLEPLTPWVAGGLATVAIEATGSVVAIEDDRRVVRWRDGGKVREVLFPRPGPN